MSSAEPQAITIYPNPCMSFSQAMDPSTTDFRAFFPYTPNEVKHRKRTTGAQLKVLESVFKHDTKPNASLRKELATQLDMTARGVQVWFQNRRAKEKNKASRAAAGTGKPANDSNSGDSEQQLEESSASPPPADSTEPAVESQSPNGTPPATGDIGDTSSQASSPVDAARPFYRVNTDSSNTSWQGSPIQPPTPLSSFASRSSNDLSDIQIASYRRGSLPVNALSPTSTQPTYGPPIIDQLDPLARRRSVDASLQRLAHNPYASVARARNAQLYGSRIVAHGHHHPAVYYGPPGRPPMHHRSTVAELDLRRSVPYTRQASPLSSGDLVRPSVPQHYVPQRTLSAQPLPGPLPSPDFSFGAPYPTSSPPLATPSLDDRSSPESFQFGYRSDETEDDASYGALSRFSSIASVTSQSSAFYSEIGPFDEPVDLKRRDSCAPAFLDMMNGLDMNALPSQGQGTQASVGTSYQESNNGAPPVENGVHAQDNADSACSCPSPTSTVSPGGSPSTHQATPPSVLISRSSELAFALQETKPEVTPTPQPASHTEQQQQPLVDINTPAATQPEFSGAPLQSHHGYAVYDQGGNYAASPASNLPMAFGDKYPFETDYAMVSPPEHYQPVMYNTPVGNANSQEDMAGMHQQHGMEYMQCPNSEETNVYGMYGDGVNSAPPATGILPPSIENALHNAESYVNYA